MSPTQNRSFRALKGFLVIVLIYAALTAVSCIFYPKGFSPLTNTLAQLGDPQFNPSGAIYYNIGACLICGSTFFTVAALLITPKQWLTARGAKRKRIFYLTLTFMFLFALLYVLLILVPSSANHGFNSMLTLLFIACLELYITSSAVGTRKLNEHIPWVPWFGFTVAILILLLVTASAITGFSIFGWIVSALSWSYTVAFLYEFSASANEPSPEKTV